MNVIQACLCDLFLKLGAKLEIYEEYLNAVSHCDSHNEALTESFWSHVFSPTNNWHFISLEFAVKETSFGVFDDFSHLYIV